MITNYGKFWVSLCQWTVSLCQNFLLANKQSKNLCVIEVLNTRRETGFNTQAKNWKGPLGLAKVWGHALLKNIWNSTFAEICFPAFWSFRQSLSTTKKKKITFLDNLFNHDLIPALRWKIDGLLIKRFSNYNLMMNIQVGDQSDYFWWSTMTS